MHTQCGLAAARQGGDLVLAAAHDGMVLIERNGTRSEVADKSAQLAVLSRVLEIDSLLDDLTTEVRQQQCQ